MINWLLAHGIEILVYSWLISLGIGFIFFVILLILKIRIRNVDKRYNKQHNK